MASSTRRTDVRSSDRRAVTRGRLVAPGSADAEAIVSAEPVPLSGVGFDPAIGALRWRGHPLDGMSLSGRVLVMPRARPFAGGDWALYGMAALQKTAPAAIVCEEADAFVTAGALLGGIPTVDGLGPADLASIAAGDRVRIDGARHVLEWGSGDGRRPRRLALRPPPSMRLTDDERRILDGAHGEGPRRCLEFLVAFGEAVGARRLLPVQSVHVAGSGYNTTGDIALGYLQSLAATGATVCVPSTLNPVALDLERWRTVLRFPDDLFEKQVGMNAAFAALGFVPLYSCAPYWTAQAAWFGAHLVWGEHNAVSYANSVLGARTNFESHVATIPAAITGRIPEYGLHLDANRRPRAIVRVEARLDDPVDWRCLGVYAATRLGDRIPLFTGLPRTTSSRQLRDLCGALGPPWASIPMLHVLGVTPEAPDLRTAFGGRVPRDVETIVVDRRRLRSARELVTTASGERVDVVALGCPQASIDDIADVVDALAGRRAHPDVRLWIWADAATRATAQRMGLLASIEDAGGQILTDTCGCAACPIDRSALGVRTLATDSTKSCGFQARTGIGTYLGTVRECLDAAVSGRWRAAADRGAAG